MSWTRSFSIILLPCMLATSSPLAFAQAGSTEQQEEEATPPADPAPPPQEPEEVTPPPEDLTPPSEQPTPTEEPEEVTPSPAEPESPPGAAPAAPAAPSAGTEEAKPKTHWWGDRNALYVETAFGVAGSKDINTSVATDFKNTAVSTLRLDEHQYGRAAVGWSLPAARGGFQLVFNGFKEEDGYRLDSAGFRAAVVGTDTEPNTPLPWWTLTLANGRLLSQRTPPVWTDADDANGNGVPEPSEVRYLPVDITTSLPAPKNLQNRLQTYELLYHRSFGGMSPTRHVSGRWTAGVRHFVYEGNIPMPLWVSTVAGIFSEGALAKPLLVSQDTSGTGPAGSLEIQSHFFRRRLSPYVQARAAFLVQTLHSDTGRAYTLARTPQGTIPTYLYPAEMSLQEDLDKSSWQTGIELGVRWTAVPGVKVQLGYHLDSFQDVLLLLDRVNIPDIVPEASFGPNAIYVTEDLEFDGWFAGLGFQF